MSLHNSAILGTFEGECADSNITNKNGLDITREVWEHVFESEDYKTGIELQHYIGFLGHPEDINSMDFQNACIVMTEGHIEDNGKVYGKFNLVDTPVGRIVKQFIDAGVTFGISVRGAGDIVHNSVDPETFTFRGFDLVTFPAFPESIPEFRAIAASTDEDSRKKYQRICASVEAEIPNLTSTETIDILQEQFPEQSETYANLEARKSELCEDEVLEFVSPETDLLQQQVNGLTDLYLQERENRDLAYKELSEAYHQLEQEKILMSRKLTVVQRICAAQERDIHQLEAITASENHHLSNRHKTVLAANKRLKSQLDSEKEAVLASQHELDKAKRAITASRQDIDNIKQQLDAEKQTNLQYRTKIEASEEVIAEKDITIRQLQQDLDKTVVEASEAVDRASNLDVEVTSLRQQITASQKLLEDYQDAYASIYSQVTGFNLENVTVTASTTVSELQQKITGSSSSLNTSNVFVEPQQVDVDDEDDGCLVTL